MYRRKVYFQFPTTAADWMVIANGFGEKYQFWNCLGAIDGKHVAVKKPAHSGSLYYNYKGFHSIVLLAVVNAKREFIMVDAGVNGKISDGGVMFYSKFGELLECNSLNLPAPAPLPNTTATYPYVFIGDEAFALHQNIMKPYAQKSLNAERQEYNRRVAQSRSVVENGFGILNTRFGVFQKPINLEPEKATKVVLACCYLHNFLAAEKCPCPTPDENNDQSSLMEDLQRSMSRNCIPSAKDVRDRLCNYFNNEGKI